jgi:hypothetical protein
MKLNLKEEILNFKRLIGEATDTSSSGAYEQPLGFNQSKHVCTPVCAKPCPHSGKNLVGSEMGIQAPTVDVVDVTQGVVPMDEPTSYEGNMDTTLSDFDNMPYLSSHPSAWKYEGDEEDLLNRHGIERPTNPNPDTDETEDEKNMSIAFDQMDDGTDVFQELKMFTETKNGYGW